MQLVAKTFHGLEEVLAKELNILGAQDIKTLKRAVSFRGEKELLYKANFHLRTALRILQPVLRFKANDEKSLYNGIYEFDWSAYLSNHKTFAIDSVVSSYIFKHSKYVALKIKDAIVDQFRKKTGNRPSVDTTNPDLRINVHIYDEDVTISLDSSGESLHKRGYRSSSSQAPLNEVLAAGMVYLSEWDRKSFFLDPMCGSGTIVMEAAMISAHIPPGSSNRKYGFMNWKDYDRTLWKKITGQGNSRINSKLGNINAADIAFSAINGTKQSANILGYENQITTTKTAFADFENRADKGVIIMNPPYGERIMEKDIFSFYKMIGDTLKQNFAGFDAWILSANKDALKHIGLRPSRKITVFNGPLECKFQKFSLYAGSKKDKPQT
ncbi:MAG: class I SAM-dependent RNA methyltransferase [Bacteroidetes bacterium]|nr:class I SAM-dependent RNA methyltransferase [Bacteroidota bacterium]